MGLREIRTLMSTTIICHFIGKFISEGGIKWWLEKNWLDFLGYMPRYHTLFRGYLERHINNILARKWLWPLVSQH
jgi:hypothetical protein